uniref:Uncharacterized protein n=1 Tax=Tanacetum cinerariifolium TaxID=118510 RepID=A0A6L2KTY5_TANCI|nr:hypothetical protein [Tanacetum cinerariifolium]
MGDEHLNTIPAMESDEFIKSYVENLVPKPSESEGENGCDVLACFTTFSNILFDVEYEFDSSDDQSLSNEYFSEEIFSNPLFEEVIISTKIDPHHFDVESDFIESMLNHDSSIIPSSSKIDSLLDEFADELTLLKSISPRINETDCYPEEEIHLTKRLLYDNSSPRPPKEFVSENCNADIESFFPSPILVEDSDSRMEEIDLSFNPDDPMPPIIEEDEYDSERDVLILKELVDNYSLSFPEKSPDLLSYRSLEIFQPSAKCPMMIHGKNIPILDVPLFHFYPLDQFKYGGNWVKLSDLKQALRRRHPMLIRSLYSQKFEDSCQRILSSKSSFPRLQLGIILLHLAGSQPKLKSSYKAEDGVIISIPPIVGGVKDIKEKDKIETKPDKNKKRGKARQCRSPIAPKMNHVGNKMHKAFPLPGESSHWQYKFPLPVEGVPTARRIEIPLPGVCTAMMKKLPTVVANSTTEAKYVAASSCSRQALWIENQLFDYGVDSKEIIITKSSVRRDLRLADEEGVDCLLNSTIFENLKLMVYEKLSQTLTFYKIFFSPQWKFLIHTIMQCLSVKTTAWNEFSSTMASAIIYLAINQKFNFSKLIFNSMIRNLNNVSGKLLMYPSLEAKQDSGTIDKTQSKATPNEANLSRTTLGGGPMCQKAIGDTIAQTRVLDLEKTKITQVLKITSLKRMVKKLKKKQRSRTHKLKRLYKGRKINDIDADEDITLVNDEYNAEMLDVNYLNGEEVFVEKEVDDKEVSAAGEVNAASIARTVSAAAIITIEEITLAKALVEIKTSKPKAKMIVLQEPNESKTTTTKIISLKQSQDKGKCIMVKEPVKLKKKDQIRLDEEAALKLQAELQAEFNEEQRLARESLKRTRSQH